MKIITNVGKIHLHSFLTLLNLINYNGEIPLKKLLETEMYVVEDKGEQYLLIMWEGVTFINYTFYLDLPDQQKYVEFVREQCLMVRGLYIKDFYQYPQVRDAIKDRLYLEFTTGG